ncbi:MAG: glycosyltransferase [Actinobacteria bacterium]|nr:MAG: glycosyltransferase [Actinomycetota bacterium]
MSEDEARKLAEDRRERRAAKDFAAADELRDRIRELGYEVVDTAEGFELTPVSERRLRPEEVESVLEQHPMYEFSVHWIVQGWSEDVARGIEGFRRHGSDTGVQHVIVDAAGSDTEWPGDVEVIALDRDPGWAIARNAGLKRTAGEIVIVIDGSIEPAGDILTPIRETLSDPEVGICGPFGIVTDDLRDFRDTEGPDCDAVEGYLMAFRREILRRAGFFDEKFRFYRTADIEFSFRVKDQGLRAVVVPLPLERHEHRMWANTPEEERARLSKRNFYRFLERWRGRTDLTVSGGGSGR